MKRLEKAIKYVAQNAVTKTGGPFLNNLVRFLSELTAKEYVFIDILKEGSEKIASTVVVCSKGEILPNV